MLKKILFFSFWSIILAILLWIIINMNFSWILFVYTPLFFTAVISSYCAMTKKTKRCWLTALLIGLCSIFIALGLLLFIDDIFDYDGGGMLPGFAYLMERMYSWLAAIVFAINLFSLTIIFLIQKKHPFIAAIVAVIEIFTLAVFLMLSK